MWWEIEIRFSECSMILTVRMALD